MMYTIDFTSSLAIKTPAGILMVEALCNLITENLSELWNLGQTYLSQQLGEKVIVSFLVPV